VNGEGGKYELLSFFRSELSTYISLLKVRDDKVGVCGVVRATINHNAQRTLGKTLE
jgi:hypothetical protein